MVKKNFVKHSVLLIFPRFIDSSSCSTYSSISGSNGDVRIAYGNSSSISTPRQRWPNSVVKFWELEDFFEKQFITVVARGNSKARVNCYSHTPPRSAASTDGRVLPTEKCPILQEEVTSFDFKTRVQRRD